MNVFQLPTSVIELCLFSLLQNKLFLPSFKVLLSDESVRRRILGFSFFYVTPLPLIKCHLECDFPALSDVTWRFLSLCHLLDVPFWAVSACICLHVINHMNLASPFLSGGGRVAVNGDYR